MTMKPLLAGVSAAGLLSAAAQAATPVGTLPTGQLLTPTAAPGASFQGLNPRVAGHPGYLVGQAESTAVSPDGKTLLVLTSGYNLNADAKGKEDPATSTEFVFVFDISKGAPSQLQALPVPNSFSGVAWSPKGDAFYVAGGQDDNVHVFTKTGAAWAEAGAPIALGHFQYGVSAGKGLFVLPPGFLGQGSPAEAAVSALAAGIGVTQDGTKLLVANMENDSLTLVDRARGNALTEIDLRPGPSQGKTGVPGGEFPFWVAVKGNDTAYVSSLRDREIVVVSLAGAKPKVTARIPVTGNPSKMVLNKAGTRLYVTADNSDQLFVVDTATNAVVGQVSTTFPAGAFAEEMPKGSTPNSVALSPGGQTAYVTDGGTNAVAVISLVGKPAVLGLIPTGWYPNSVSVSADGTMLYVVNGKSDGGPDPKEETASANQYVLQTGKAGFLTLPVPSAANLALLTAQVAKNDGFGYQPSPVDLATMDFLHRHIQHIVYIVKENRTYDQVLGDLGKGNGDPALVMYGQATTPNFHALAGGFVDLDNFYCSGEVSMDGWQWSTAGRGIDTNEKVVTVNYGKGGGSYDSEGLSRDIDVAWPTGKEREAADPVYGLMAINDPDLLPGTANAVAADGPGEDNQGAGYLWNAALRAGLTVRNYGFFEDEVQYEAPAALGGVAPLTNPYATKTQVAFPADPALMNLTDLYFRGFDNQLPDFYRYREWAREFAAQIKSGSFPAFETVRLMHDHTGNFSTAVAGVNTPELQQADNDYAVGLLVERIAHSPYASSTLVFVLEDDAQDGPDHVDGHRSTAYIAGPYVKQGQVVHGHYATVNMLRTIEDILGTEHLSLHDAGVAPMTGAFDTTQAKWSYTAVPSQLLCGTQLPLPAGSCPTAAAVPRPLHDAAWWAERTRDFRFVKEDQNNAGQYNRVLWSGTMGDRPYPAGRSGADLTPKQAD